MISLFFFNDTATTEIYTLSLHDALPIYEPRRHRTDARGREPQPVVRHGRRRSDEARREPHPDCPLHPGPESAAQPAKRRSEEHTSELQSRQYLVCRLLLEKKKNLSVDQS